MQVKHIVWSCAGGLVLVLASAAYAADTPANMTASPPPEAASAPADASAAQPAENTTAAVNTTDSPPPENTVAPAKDQVSAATETPSDAVANPSSQERMAADSCADNTKAPASLDCEKLKRRVDSKGSAANMSTCTSHMDAKGNVVFDDPACPTRIRPVVNDPGNVYRIRENPFFSLHIDKATNHALKAEIAGKQGRAIDLMDHAQMALLQAKEAQRAGNLPGLNEGIIQLTEALRLPEGTPVRDATAYVRDARKNLHQAAGSKLLAIEQFENVAAYRE
jgi:hypothetical protein